MSPMRSWILRKQHEGERLEGGWLWSWSHFTFPGMPAAITDSILPRSQPGPTPMLPSDLQCPRLWPALSVHCIVDAVTGLGAWACAYASGGWLDRYSACTRSPQYPSACAHAPLLHRLWWNPRSKIKLLRISRHWHQSIKPYMGAFLAWSPGWLYRLHTEKLALKGTLRAL